jgi:hypothetical protein
LTKNFGMKVIVSQKTIENPNDDLFFYAEELSPALYPILCKANIELLRKKESFDRWKR